MSPAMTGIYDHVCLCSATRQLPTTPVLILAPLESRGVGSLAGANTLERAT